VNVAIENSISVPNTI